MITAAKKFDLCLKNLLTLTGMTCGELARHLNVPMPVVRRWMSGVSAPDIYQFREIAHFFGLPYTWFLDGGSGFPNAEELAGLLGLNPDTVEGLLLLADMEDEDVLEPLDEAIYAVVSAFRTILEGGNSHEAEQH